MTENHPATRANARVALVTCADLPDLDSDDRRLLAPLRARGIEAVPAVWDDPAVDWSSFDLAVLRSAWDYPARRPEFLAWAGRVPRLANPVDVVTWNTDKRYLVDLALADLPVVPTTWVTPDDGSPLGEPATAWLPAEAGEFVVKPAIGAGSKQCGKYRLEDPAHRQLAVDHVARLREQGQLVLVQPYLSAVDTYGETSVLFLADPRQGDLAYSHAIRKGPMLTGPDMPTGELYRPEQITARVPSAAEQAMARRVLAALPTETSRLLYARVDLIPGQDGRPIVVEVEVTEPSLFLGHDPAATQRFATAIASKLAHNPR